MESKGNTIQLNCPQCKGPRTIYFDHIRKLTYPWCPRCDGSSVRNA